MKPALRAWNWLKQLLKPAIEDATERAMFEDERALVVLRAVPIICAFGAATITLGVSVDALIAPAALLPLCIARALSIAGLGGCYWFGTSGRTATPNRASALLSVTCIVIGLEIISTAYLTGGGASAYHTSFMLEFPGVALVSAWTLRAAGCTFTGLALAYDIVMITTGNTADPGVWATDNFMVWGAVFLSLVPIAVNDRLRQVEFLSRLRLADAIKTLADANNQVEAANLRLTELDQEKNQIFANLSHEFRTPLTLILAPLDALLEKSSLAPGERYQVELTRRNAMRILKLIDDLLELSRFDAGAARMNFSRLDLEAFVRGAASLVSPLAQKKHIVLELDTGGASGLHVDADPIQLERAVMNILANALKFTEEGGTIGLCLQPRDDGVEISVRDTGCGIGPEALPRIFERFFQVDVSKRRRYGGTGIGLSFVKGVIEAHGGKVRAESTLGEGTRLFLWIPQQQKSMLGVNAAAEPSPWSETLRESTEYRLLSVVDASGGLAEAPRSHDENLETVLVVDDNPEIAQLVTSLLVGEFNVVSAGDGEAGLAMAKLIKPTLILSDVNMPGKTGYEMAQALREDGVTQHIPIILLTVRGSTEDRIEGRHVDVEAHISKPFSPHELRATVESVLRKHGKQLASMREDRDFALQILAEGTAHEILNPLGFVSSALYAMQKIVDKAAHAPGIDPKLATALREQSIILGDGATEGIARVQYAVESLRRITRRGNRAAVQPIDVNDSISRVLKLVGLRTVVETLDLTATASVGFTPGQLEQVLLNLLINAKQAAGERCKLQIQTRDEPDSAGVHLSVTDNGPGVPPENLERIFYPYFTTKGPNEGSGLGLAMSRQIIREHGGQLTVHSKIGHGATFAIWLPRFVASLRTVS